MDCDSMFATAVVSTRRKAGDVGVHEEDYWQKAFYRCFSLLFGFRIIGGWTTGDAEETKPGRRISLTQCFCVVRKPAGGLHVTHFPPASPPAEMRTRWRVLDWIRNLTCLGRRCPQHLRFGSSPVIDYCGGLSAVRIIVLTETQMQSFQLSHPIPCYVVCSPRGRRQLVGKIFFALASREEELR